jgi:hypothetical protein
MSQLEDEIGPEADIPTQPQLEFRGDGFEQRGLLFKGDRQLFTDGVPTTIRLLPGDATQQERDDAFRELQIVVAAIIGAEVAVEMEGRRIPPVEGAET